MCQPVDTPEKPDPNAGRASQQAAKAFHTNRDYVAEAERLQQEDPETLDAVKAGKTTLKAVKTKRKQREAREKAAGQAKAAPGRAAIMEIDALMFLSSVGGVGLAPFDLLLTDPPYMAEVDDIADFSARWVPKALSRLKPSGRAYIFTGSYPQELQTYLDVLLRQEGWTLANVLVWTYENTIGPAPTHDYERNWQAIWYLRGPDASKLNSPVLTEQFAVHAINAPDGRLGDRFHTWQKLLDLAERFIRHSTVEGAQIIDPFGGTGTFLITAAQLGRDALGCDHDPKMIEIARRRGVQYVSRCGAGFKPEYPCLTPMAIVEPIDNPDDDHGDAIPEVEIGDVAEGDTDEPVTVCVGGRADRPLGVVWSIGRRSVAGQSPSLWGGEAHRHAPLHRRQNGGIAACPPGGLSRG